MALRPLSEAIPNFKVNEEKADKFINGGENEDWITSNGETVPTMRKLTKRIGDDANALQVTIRQEADANKQAIRGEGDQLLADIRIEGDQLVADVTEEVDHILPDARLAAEEAKTWGAKTKDNLDDLIADTAMTPENTQVGDTVVLRELFSSVSVVDDDEDFESAGDVKFKPTKFARAKASAFITPEEVGVTIGRMPAGDETALISKALLGAIEHGYALQLNRMYSVGPIDLPASKKGLTLTGLSGMRQKNGAGNDVGLIARAAPGGTQSHLLKFGQNGVGGDFENFRSDGVTYHGNDAILTEGLIWADRLSQGGGMLNTFTRARGPAFMFNKGEDLIFYGTSMVLLGNNDGRGPICFGRASGFDAASAIGSNIIRFIGGRMEWIDGPFVGLHPDQLDDAWASHIFITDMKHEVGQHTVDGVTYGTSRANWPVYYFPTGAAGSSGGSAGSESEANTGNRVSVVLHHPFINIAYNSRSVFWVGNVDDFVIKDPQFTLNNTATLTLFELQDENEQPCEARNFVLTGGNIRGNGGNPWMTESQLNWINKNKLPIHFDIPNMSDLGGLPAQINEQVSGMRSMARYGNRPEITSGVQGSYFIQDPDPVNDPAVAMEGSVLKIGRSTTALRLAKSTQFNGRNIGLGGHESGRSLRVRVRAKRVGNGSQNLYFRNDALSNIVGKNITSTAYTWYEFLIPVVSIGKGLRLNATNVDSDNYILVDAYKLDFVDYFEKTFQVNIPNLAANQRVAVATDNGGAPLTIPGAAVGDRVEWWLPPQLNGNTEGVEIDPQITAADTLTVYARNPTGAAIDLPGYAGWVFRVHSR